MTAEDETRGKGSGSLRIALAQGVAFLATRGELALLELADARQRVLRGLVLALVAAVLLLAALLTLSLWVAALFWDGPRELALGLLALGYLLGAVLLVVKVRRQMAAAPPLLSLTRAELEKDRQALRAHLGGADDDAS